MRSCPERRFELVRVRQNQVRPDTVGAKVQPVIGNAVCDRPSHHLGRALPAPGISVADYVIGPAADAEIVHHAFDFGVGGGDPGFLVGHQTTMLEPKMQESVRQHVGPLGAAAAVAVATHCAIRLDHAPAILMRQFLSKNMPA